MIRSCDQRTCYSNSSSVNINRRVRSEEGYADDTILVAEPTVALENLVDRGVEERRKGLTINCEKTECMVVSRKKTLPGAT